MFAQTPLPVALHHVPPLELPTTELAGIRGRDATLVAEMPGDGVLVQVSPPTPVAAVGEALRLAVRPGFLVGDVAAGQVGLLRQRGNYHSYWREETVRIQLQLYWETVKMSSEFLLKPLTVLLCSDQTVLCSGQAPLSRKECLHIDNPDGGRGVLEGSGGLPALLSNPQGTGLAVIRSV